MRLLALVGLVALLGGCGVGVDEEAAAPDQASDSTGFVRCGQNSDCDAGCDGPGTGVCYAHSCYCTR